ncbi:MAG: hemolysin family protein [Acidobacteriota bacterium]
MTTILIVASITLLGSFLCSLFEAVLYAVTPSQIEILKESGKSGANKLAGLREHIDEPIAAILTVNTITHTVGSAWCGAMVGRHFGDPAVGVFAAVFTIAVLVFTEIIPKSFGVRHAFTLGPLVAWPMQGMIWMVWPIVKASKVVMGWIGGKGGHGEHPSEDEVMALSRLAHAGGSLRPEEQRWVENALLLDQVTAGDLMTPRTVVHSEPLETPLSALRDLGGRWRHSRVPVTEGADKDEVRGLVLRREVVDRLLADEASLTLGDLMRPMEFVAETMRGHELLNKLIQERQHMVGVTDEYGGFEGVVTLEDVLECLLGSEIVDEHDLHDDLQEVARRRALEN